MSDNLTENTTPETQDENQLIAERRRKLNELREKAISLNKPAFPNRFRRNASAEELHALYENRDKPALEELNVMVSMSGRIMAKRIMGKASFLQIQDHTGRMQFYARRDDLPEGVYADFKTWDIGDIVGGTGKVFKTNKGELSVHLDTLELLTKSLRPLPEKYHGLTDTETRYRRRYVDLIMNAESREVFKQRTRIIAHIRGLLNALAFMEVETPMMHPIPGGAVARPFKTHHNALDMQLYLRIAPELYLKRLTVGGFERVYEINRSFRNEGLSTRHNPEFTMLELYWAYADFNDLMDLVEQMVRSLANMLGGDGQVVNEGKDYDLTKPFLRLSVADAILKYNPDIDPGKLRDRGYLISICEQLKIPVKDSFGEGKLQIEIFEKTVEDRLMEPTFITMYPTEVSPLSRRNDDDPFLTDRFEFFIGGRELANGFSELNDAEDQAQRFKDQATQKDAGDDEAMFYDADYIQALEYGMPPTAGLGVGIDRLVMFLTDSASIRDVLLFPTMRPE
jgi:lysyl-tRNA synthetase class 2